MKKGIVKAVCISEKRGTAKHDIGEGTFYEFGIEADSHAGDWHRQVSLLSYDKVREFNEKGANVDHGAFGENLVVEGLDFKSFPIGTIYKAGDVVLQMTQIGKECHTHCEIYKRMGECIMPHEGVFAKVLKPGTIKVGDEMEVLLPIKAAILTASDKGSRGEREDLSGPAIKEIIEPKGYVVEEYKIVPDDFDVLCKEIKRIADENIANVLFTTGGTGFAERDVTPEATRAVCARRVPGIPEAMRAYSMTITKRAMLSRAEAGIRKNTLVINMPGSPKAVTESLEYIIDELRHGIEILIGEAQECARK